MNERPLPDFSAGAPQPQIREIVGPDGKMKRYRAVDANFHPQIGVAQSRRNNRLGFGEKPKRA